MPSPTKKQLAYLLAFDGLAIQLVGLAIGLGAVGGGNALGFAITGVGLTIFVVSLAVAGETSDHDGARPAAPPNSARQPLTGSAPTRVLGAPPEAAGPDAPHRGL